MGGEDLAGGCGLVGRGGVGRRGSRWRTVSGTKGIVLAEMSALSQTNSWEASSFQETGRWPRSWRGPGRAARRSASRGADYRPRTRCAQIERLSRGLKRQPPATPPSRLLRPAAQPGATYQQGAKLQLQKKTSGHPRRDLRSLSASSARRGWPRVFPFPARGPLWAMGDRLRGRGLLGRALRRIAAWGPQRGPG